MTTASVAGDDHGDPAASVLVGLAVDDLYARLAHDPARVLWAPDWTTPPGGPTALLGGGVGRPTS